ncbi:hypothetical protein [Denitromonas sp.]|uniref:hypothetical protein n=1 Tax=Denitromonas sp. TaxID=2734609 RepID=UPI002AFF5E6D|nr:hypothetical protein [Denitromonas sp.]
MTALHVRGRSLLMLLGLLCAAVLGALLGLGQREFAALSILGLGGLVLLYLTVRGVEDTRAVLIYCGWAIMLLTPLLQHLSGVPVGYVLEVLIFGLGIAAIRRVWCIAGQDRWLRTLMALFLCYLVLSLLSSVFGRSLGVAALWQFQYNLKWPLMFGLGTLIVWNVSASRAVQALVGWSWVFILPFVVIEILAPALHSQLVGPATDSQLNPFLGVGARYRGPFAHAGYLAIISAFLAAVAWVDVGRARWKSMMWVGVYSALVVLSGQRQEAAALLVVFLLFAALRCRRVLPQLLVPLAFLIGCGVVLVLMFDYIPMRSTLAQWGLLDSLAPLSERAILTRGGLDVAQSYFPLGSGLGTYGGAGAQKFDLSLFEHLGFGRYWWFLQGKFIVDTYWPCVVAESGFFGAFLILSLLLMLWVGLVARVWTSTQSQERSLLLIATAAMTLLLANTPSSAVLTDPRGAFVLWLLIGMACRYSFMLRMR